jgi:predicted methyltransferase
VIDPTEIVEVVRLSRTEYILPTGGVMVADGSIWPKRPRRLDDPDIIEGDCLEVMASRIPDASIDMVVTSPPYNLNLAYSLYDDTRAEREYVDWLVGVANQIKRVLKPQGSFF